MNTALKLDITENEDNTGNISIKTLVTITNAVEITGNGK